MDDDRSILSLAAAFKALSNVNRMAIFDQVRLSQPNHDRQALNALTSSDIASKFNLSLSTISHHIKELRRTGLIACERQGQFVLLYPVDTTIRMMIQYLSENHPEILEAEAVDVEG